MCLKVVVYEPCADGHRLWYVRLIAEWALRTGRDVELVTLPGVPESREFQVHLGHLPLRTITLCGDADTARFVAGRRIVRRLLTRLLEEGLGTVEAVFVPDADLVIPQWLSLPVLAYRQRKLFVFLLMRTPRRRTTLGAVKMASAITAIMRGASVGQLVGPTTPQIGMLASVSDPVWGGEYDKQMVRSALGLRDGESVALIIGALDERKSLPQILNAWNNPSSHEGISWSLAVVGQLDGRMRKVIDKARLPSNRIGRLLVRDEYVDEFELQQWIVAADLVLALNRNTTTPSGIAMRARAQGVPLLVTAGLLPPEDNVIVADPDHPDLGSTIAHALLSTTSVSPSNLDQSFMDLALVSQRFVLQLAPWLGMSSGCPDCHLSA